MKPIDLILILILTLIAVLICVYIYKQKKKGTKCIGCPYGKSCSGSCQENKK